MKKQGLFLTLIISLMVLVTSCGKEAIPTNEIQGKWIIESIHYGGVILPGDGSFLIFMGGKTDCRGTSYAIESQTIGSFFYDFSQDQKTLMITDNDEDGGNFNNNFNVENFTDTDLRISATLRDEGGIVVYTLKRN